MRLVIREEFTMGRKKIFKKQSKLQTILKSSSFLVLSILMGILLGEWGYQYITSIPNKTAVLTDELLMQKNTSDIQIEEKKILVEKSLWQKNAAQFTAKQNMAKIVLVIDDMGLNYSRTKEIVKIKAPLTLSFLPYASHLRDQVHWAKQNGHELLVHVPMEPIGKQSYKEPNLLTIGLNDEEFIQKLTWDLSQFDGYIGINNHMGSLLTSNKPAMKKVMGELKKRGLIFLDSKTSHKSVASDVAESYNIPNLSRDIFIDHELNKEHILQQLQKTEEIAQEYGQVIAICHPHKLTIEALKDWLPTLEEKQLQVVPLSHLLPRKQVKKK